MLTTSKLKVVYNFIKSAIKFIYMYKIKGYLTTPTWCPWASKGWARKAFDPWSNHELALPPAWSMSAQWDQPSIALPPCWRETGTRLGLLRPGLLRPGSSWSCYRPFVLRKTCHSLIYKSRTVFPPMSPVNASLSGVRLLCSELPSPSSSQAILQWGLRVSYLCSWVLFSPFSL